MNEQPFIEPAAPILRAEPSITDGQRADLFDIFHGSKDSNELAQKLQPVPIPDATKQLLFDAKKRSTVQAEPIDKAMDAVKRVGSLDPKVLDLAEAHPNVLKVLSAAAIAKEGAEAGSASGKGKDAKKQTPLVQPPRPDGAEHLPPIPDNHRRILARDGSVHDIPEENLEKARAIDPMLHVLNP